MKTLVVEQHKTQYCSSSKPQDHGRFEYSSSKDFIGINCRTFESGFALLPTTPLKSFDESPKSSPIPINGKGFRKERFFDGTILLSELWAGPTYSNSPPPSSLPIPRFSVRPKRTVSLDLPGSSREIELRMMAKSVPSSPTRERLDFIRDVFVNADSATKTLRRILNLNIGDDE
ncbi:hypothetical protein RYX36_019087 [Vicia faba]